MSHEFIFAATAAHSFKTKTGMGSHANVAPRVIPTHGSFQENAPTREGVVLKKQARHWELAKAEPALNSFFKCSMRHAFLNALSVWSSELRFRKTILCSVYTILSTKEGCRASIVYNHGFCTMKRRRSRNSMISATSPYLRTTPHGWKTCAGSTEGDTISPTKTSSTNPKKGLCHVCMHHTIRSCTCDSDLDRPKVISARLPSPGP